LIGNKLFEVTVLGNVSTNSNKETIYEWRGTLERFFSSLPNSSLQTRKISINLKFWINEKRLKHVRGNDLDNLSKPVLDALKRIGIIRDDDQIYHLEATKFPTSNDEGVEVIVKDWH
jgi:Holliday junction resolvase RusA-like endonuclease